MFRIAASGDRQAFCRLWQQVFGDDPAFSGPVFDSFAGPGHVFLSEGEGGRLEAILSAVPVTLDGHEGFYLYGLATDPACRGKGLMTGLMEWAESRLAIGGAQFLCLIPASASLFEFYGARGYQKAFGLRQFTRPIRANLWAQADFDSVTAKALLELRRRFCPHSVTLTLNGMVQVLTDLYSGGLTIVSDEAGYGLYFQHREELEVIELFAEGDRAAERLLEAARQKTGAETARITLGHAQTLFAGEGIPQDYGMIHFLAQPFEVGESYMRLMMDNEG